jgi:hypothetical protein
VQLEATNAGFNKVLRSILRQVVYPVITESKTAPENIN